MSKHLVFVGGGHAHMTCLKNVRSFTERGHRVTLVSRSPYQYYSGMGPGMLAGTYEPTEIRFNIKKMAENAGGSFIEGTAARVDPKARTLFLEEGDEIEYDIVSFNTGSSVPVGNVSVESGGNVFTVKPIENLLKAQALIASLIRGGKPRIVVVGGGPAGLEISANTWRFVHNHRAACRITLLPGPTWMAGFPHKVRRIAGESFSARGIEVAEGSFVKSLASGRAVCEDGREFPYDLAFLALGVKPSKLFQESGLPTGPDGGLLTNKYLQSTSHPEIFGGGDCISFQDRPLDKVGVYAVRENPILYHNLMAALEARELTPFDPQDAYLLIFNLGDGKGIFRWKNWVFDGKLAFYVKDYIDRRFIRGFQVSGEQEETRGSKESTSQGF